MDIKRATARIEAARREARRNRNWAGSLMMTNLLMLLALVLVLGKQQTILTNINDGKSYAIGGQHASNEYIRDMASQFVAITVNVHPKNVERQNEKFLKYTDPEIFGELKNQLSLEAMKIKKESISQTFYEQSVDIDPKSKNRVVVTGIRKIFYGKKLVSDIQTRYRINFKIRNGRLWISKFSELKKAEKPFVGASK
ncbi:hypothetical protein MNBD_GAMMA12-3098 [hydrothermal vent metagenome]|uniref:Type IV conjugative transfer system protein TraE n=1 Tax=hydrothermal vent metagenome TaxID=652676 RepID=A0A3B0Z5Y8_9ZZZZ